MVAPGGVVAAVLCPHPPLLFRELSGIRDVAADLREVCHDVLREGLAIGPDRVLVVGGGDETGRWDGKPDVRRFGTTGPRPAGPGLPLSVGVGRRLLDDVGWTGPTELRTLGMDASDDELAAAVPVGDERTLVLALGDGSTRRGDKAPGYLDERSFPFDRATAQALAAGDAAALRDLDNGLAEELMVLGRAVFRFLGTLGEPTSARLAYHDDPFGVAYHVALWRYA